MRVNHWECCVCVEVLNVKGRLTRHRIPCTCGTPTQEISADLAETIQVIVMTLVIYWEGELLTQITIFLRRPGRVKTCVTCIVCVLYYQVSLLLRYGVTSYLGSGGCVEAGSIPAEAGPAPPAPVEGAGPAHSRARTGPGHSGAPRQLTRH